METPFGYVSHEAYRGAMERAYEAEREVHRLTALVNKLQHDLAWATFSNSQKDSSVTGLDAVVSSK
jgi:hypothetical protein